MEKKSIAAMGFYGCAGTDAPAPLPTTPSASEAKIAILEAQAVANQERIARMEAEARWNAERPPRPSVLDHVRVFM